MKQSLLGLVVTFMVAMMAQAGEPSRYDVAAFVWPAYQPDPRWAELGIFGAGKGEWQNVWEAEPKWNGHDQPRKPLWGYENEADPKVMEKKIDTAVAHGVNVFIYDWYWYGGRPFLEDAVAKGFLGAKNNGKMKFFLMWANHNVNHTWNNKVSNKNKDGWLWTGGIKGDDFKVVVKRWIEQFFSRPNYYRIEGKPVLMIYDMKLFVKGFGGIDEAAKAMDYVREECRKAGLGGLHFMATDYGLQPQWVKPLGIDSATIYNFVHWSDSSRNPEYSAWCAHGAQRFAKGLKDLGVKAYFAHASVGWDTNPRWPKENVMGTVMDSTPAKFEATLKVAKTWCDEHTPAGYPKLITINSWNEWTEGSYLEPDTKFRFGYLEAIRNVFQPQARIVYDFETGDLQGWKVTEGFFEKPVSDRAKEHNTGKPYVKGGKWFLTTLENKRDESIAAQMGRVQSPLIRLASPTIKFRVGGGNNQCDFCLVDRQTGEIYARAVGRNDEPLLPAEWTVPRAVGREVFFCLSDLSGGPWAYIAVDDIVCEGEVLADDFSTRTIGVYEPRPAPSMYAAAEAAVRELGARFPDYPVVKFLADLAKLKQEDAPLSSFEAKRIEALVRANPLVNAHEILYTTHAMWPPDHHNTASLFQCGEVNTYKYATQGALRALNLKTGLARDIVGEILERTVRDPEVDFEAKRIVFAMRRSREEDYHIWSVNVDGSDMRQLTSAKGVCDVQPAWLADGGIVFTSTREPKYCGCNRHIMANLFRMEGDGANIHQIGRSTLFEEHPVVLADGRILYDRWEYVDRNFADAQALWTCNADGTRHTLFWGNNTACPGALMNARPLSDPSRAIAVFGSCHDRQWGALGIVDRTKGVDGKEPVLRTWPAAFRDEIRASSGNTFDSRLYVRTRRLECKYADPFPLDDEHFLCVRQTGHGEETGIFYLDLHGNEVLVHRDGLGCHDPMPIRPMKRPPVQSVQRNYADVKAPGRFYVQDVYVGTHMKGVKRGSIKAIRVVESPEKRQWIKVRSWWNDAACTMNWRAFDAKRVLGTVPVAEDGSAYFEVPGNTYVFFQALDAEGKMVQSMRSGVILQPGETYGCVGCHESRGGDLPKMDKKGAAFSRVPSKLDGAYNLQGLYRGRPPTQLSYQREVQPVFTRHCVACHDYGKPAGTKLNLSGDRGAYFCTSYVDLCAKGYVECPGDGPAETLNAYSWGARASRLLKVIEGVHKGVKLANDEREAVIAWLDLNVPYWPVYECAWPDNYGGRMPITCAEHDRLQQLAGRKISNSYYSKQLEQLDFDRPECSRILDPIRGKPTYAEALAIIQKGKERLKTNPRADMEGFVPCAAHQERERRYQRRADEERSVYDALRQGQKRYDAVQRR